MLKKSIISVYVLSSHKLLGYGIHVNITYAYVTKIT